MSHNVSRAHDMPVSITHSPVFNDTRITASVWQSITQISFTFSTESLIINASTGARILERPFQISQILSRDLLCRESFVQSVGSEFLACFVFKINIQGLSNDTFDILPKIWTWKRARTLRSKSLGVKTRRRQSKFSSDE